MSLAAAWAVALVATGCGAATAERDALTMWYEQPATCWEETLPLGNGRLGMMPDGGVAGERIVLNDISLWSGSEYDPSNPDAVRWLPKIRSLLQAGRNLEAQELMFNHFSCLGGGSTAVAYGTYQTLGALTLDFGFGERADSAVTEYERGLRLSNATAYTRFTRGGVHYNREYFVSRTGDVMALRLRASERGALDLSIALSRPEHARIACEEDRIVMRGALPSGQPGVEGMRFAAKLGVQSRGGAVAAEGERLAVQGADEVVIYLSAATSFWRDDFEQQVDSLLDNALATDFDALRRAHETDYRRLFDRVKVDLGPTPEELPTDQRLMRLDSVADPAFAALYLQFGRYLLISSTREGSLPPNLQGLWAEGVTTPWNGDYHLNINVEMNHWISESGNLAELHRPLIDYAHRMVPSGEATARNFYGTGGWCAHVLANPWNFTAPSENPSWGATNTGGAWLALHLWEHYRFTPDTTFLREAYPVMRGAAQFLLENLIEEPDHGWLVTAPTSSPENGYYDEDPERVTFICMGSTMDVQIMRELFGAVIESSAVLETDAAFAEQLRTTLKRLPPHQVSEEGYLMEWLKDYREWEPRHRHVSHLFGLFPGSLLTRNRTPELMEACRTTLDRRGDEGTGWSRAWKVCFWARLGDGDRAWKLLRSLWTPAFLSGELWQAGGTYPNLFCSHPPFQIDGNFGGAAGIAEMLLQSHDGMIEVLPAWPEAWRDGSFEGLKARGNVEVDCRWRDRRIEEVTLRSATDQQLRLLLPGEASPCEINCRANTPHRIQVR